MVLRAGDAILNIRVHPQVALVTAGGRTHVRVIADRALLLVAARLVTRARRLGIVLTVAAEASRAVAREGMTLTLAGLAIVSQVNRATEEARLALGASVTACVIGAVETDDVAVTGGTLVDPVWVLHDRRGQL